MPSVQNLNDIGNLEVWEEGRRFIGDTMNRILQVVNGNLEIGFNLKMVVIDAVFSAANTSVRFEHGLGKVPTGYVLCKSNVSATIFDGTSDNTASTIFLQSSSVANTKVLIF